MTKNKVFLTYETNGFSGDCVFIMCYDTNTKKLFTRYYTIKEDFCEYLNSIGLYKETIAKISKNQKSYMDDELDALLNASDEIIIISDFAKKYLPKNIPNDKYFVLLNELTDILKIPFKTSTYRRYKTPTIKEVEEISGISLKNKDYPVYLNKLKWIMEIHKKYIGDK